MTEPPAYPVPPRKRSGVVGVGRAILIGLVIGALTGWTGNLWLTLILATATFGGIAVFSYLRGQPRRSKSVRS